MAGNTSKTKQVIIIRKDLDLSVGKVAAQVAHASLSAVLEMNSHRDSSKIEINTEGVLGEWFNERFTKIVLYVKSEQELIDYYNKAKENGLNVSRLIRDAGFTELAEPTLTCFAIGPNLKEEIDEITGKLRTFSSTGKEDKRKKYLKQKLKQSVSKEEEERLKSLL